jgi:ribosome biogenesis GTPase / thiamine phosphate phosphatase
MKGIVVRTTGSSFRVLDDSGVVNDCKLKGNFRIKGIRSTNPVAVGDKVEFNLLPGEGYGLIYLIEDRHNYIIRRSTKLSKATHIIAANLDIMIIVASIEQPRTSTGFIDRLLVTAEAYHIPAAVVFNKCDLYSSESGELVEKLIKLYNSLGYISFKTSVITGEGLKEFNELLSGKVALLSGHSGVGKSALVNYIEPDLHLRTGIISDFSGKGMHTTTFAEMFSLQNGGFLIDTPGIKEFGLVHFESSEVAERFPEFRKLLPQCRYNNCTHVHEPGCAVKQALENGEIDPVRYKNYLSILNDENLDAIEY